MTKKTYFNSSHSRSDILEYSFKSREPILNLQRVLIGLLQQRDELQIDLDNCWLRTAKIARKNGLFQTAHSSLLNVNDSDQIDILMEKATWHARFVIVIFQLNIILVWEKSNQNGLLFLEVLTNNNPFFVQQISRVVNIEHCIFFALLLI